MTEVTIIGIDLAKRVFQLHGARHDGSADFRCAAPAKRCCHGSLCDGARLGPGVGEAGA